MSLVSLVGGMSLALEVLPFLSIPALPLLSVPLLFVTGLSPLGQKRLLFPLLQRSLELALCIRCCSPILQCDYQEEEYCEDFFRKPKEVLSHIFLVSPQIFTLSSWSVVAMPAEEGFLTSRLKHKIGNQASWVLLNSTTYICIAYHSFFLFFAFSL